MSPLRRTSQASGWAVIAEFWIWLSLLAFLAARVVGSQTAARLLHAVLGSDAG